MASDEKKEMAPTVPAPVQGGVAGAGTDSNESPDVDTPAWEGPAPESDEGPKLVDPRPGIPGPTGI